MLDSRELEKESSNLEEVIDTSKIDESRFEQEVLFYIEKQDVQAKSASRLAVHCDHFEEIMTKLEPEKNSAS